MGLSFPTRELRQPWEPYRVSILYYSTFFSKIKEDGRLFHKKSRNPPLWPSLYILPICLHWFTSRFTMFVLTEKPLGKANILPLGMRLDSVILPIRPSIRPEIPSSLNARIFAVPSAMLFRASPHSHQRKRCFYPVPRHAAYRFERRPRISEMLRGTALQNSRSTIYTT